MIRWLVFILCLAAAPVSAACRQALALGLDISGSVDDREYRLQMSGLADALGRDSVRAALFAMPGTWVDLAVFEWAGPDDFRLTQPFVALRNATALDATIGRLTNAARPDADPSTALGTAMRRGAALLNERDCWRRTLDLSGDGKSNTGPRPRNVRQGLGSMTINALAVGSDDAANTDRRAAEIAELSAYFRAEVVHGPDAFVETALGFEDYADALERKLLRELAVVAIGLDQ